MFFVSRLIKKYATVRLMFVGGICVVLIFIFHLSLLPSKLYSAPSAKILLAKNGDLLAAKIASDQQWRFPRTYYLPKKYITAVTTFEDKYFYQHFGVNPVAIARALWGNLQKGRVVSGGSTITMQLARILRKDPPRTYLNKIIEIYIALKLEWHYSKDELLCLYASYAPFGGNTVGIGAASWRYFGRYLDHSNGLQLTWAEAALLAVLPNSPALMHPGRSRGKLKVKRDGLLLQLHNAQKLSANEYELALLEPLPKKPKSLPRHAPHLLETLIQEHPSTNVLTSTIEAELQKKINTIASLTNRQLIVEGVHNLSVVVINNQTMTTSAYIGNITGKNDARQYAASLDIARRPRSTGSILKPLLYGLMLQAGEILPTTLVPDIPINYQGFTPENYDHEYRGAVPAKQALSQSLNIPAVRMLKDHGVARFYDELEEMGMTTLLRPPNDYGLSLILGGAEGSLWEITGIYAKLLNSARSGWDGNAKSKISILKASTKVIESPNKNGIDQQSFSLNQGAAWLTLEALHEVLRPGTDSLWRDFSQSQKIAWKTGTSYGLRDAWAIGSNGKYTVGVWAGNAGGEGVSGLSGLKTAGPMLFQIFDLLGNSDWIQKPEFALKTVQACKNDGYLAAGNCEPQAIEAPLGSHFQTTTPFHKKIQLDKEETFRVHGGCENVSNMVTKNWLILPPAQEYYWKQNHAEFHTLPPWREDCIAELTNYSNDMPMDIVYPLEGSKVYIPIGLNGGREQIVFKATHRSSSATLYWHLDDRFIQETDLFHNVMLNLSVGWHKLILIDNSGFKLERWFKVLGEENV